MTPFEEEAAEYGASMADCAYCKASGDFENQATCPCPAYNKAKDMYLTITQNYRQHCVVAAEQAFCETSGCDVSWRTCTSLGTCPKYDQFKHKFYQKLEQPLLKLLEK